MRILAIEASCDDTGAAIVLEGRNILSNVVPTQVALHQKYGGIVPELASRRHIEASFPIVTEAMERAGVPLKKIDGIAVTQCLFEFLVFQDLPSLRAKNPQETPP